MLPHLPRSLAEYRELEAHELALGLVKYLRGKLTGPRSGSKVNRAIECNPNNLASHYPQEEIHEIRRLLAEAWNSADAQGLIARSPGQSNPWFIVTRLGERVTESAEAEQAWGEARRLSRDLLHPKVDGKSWGPYLRGDYDTAVFTAFKEVEVAVRNAGGFKPGDHGVPMIMEAFKPHVGPLTDAGAEEAEQIALRRLFAGALGSYKNPNSHRHVDLSPHEAAEMIVLASHLLRIVEARTPVPDSDS